MTRAETKTVAENRPGTSVNIYQDGHPITVTNTLFPPGAVDRVRLGIYLGIGFSIGVALVVSAGSILVQLSRLL